MTTTDDSMNSFMKQVDAILRERVKKLLADSKQRVFDNQAKRRRDGDSRDPDGTTWRDRPSLL